MNHRAFTLVFALSFVFTAGSTTGGLRRFSPNDAALVGASADRAAYITSLNHTWVATKDLYTKPDCSGRDRFIVVSAAPGAGEWMGGNPGCLVMEMALPEGLVEFAFNPYCQLVPELINGSCLKLPSENADVVTMRSRLRPAKWQEVVAILNRYYVPEDGEPRVPASIDGWYVAKGTQPLPVVPLFGAEALKIIVPEGVKLAGGLLGHNQLYLHQEGPYGDPLCQAVKLHGISQLPLKFSGAELEYIQSCEQ